MQFPFPFLEVLTLPLDGNPAVDGGLILDGVNGEILLYDTNGNLVGLLTPSDPTLGEPGFFLFAGGSLEDFVALANIGGFPGVTLSVTDADKLTDGRISYVVNGVGGTRNFELEIETGQFSGQSRATLTLLSDSQDGSEAADIRFNGASLPRGIVARFESDTATAALASGATTDFAFTYTPLDNAIYELCFHSQADPSIDGANWRLNVHENGVLIKRLGQENIDADAETLSFRTFIKSSELDVGNSNTYDVRLVNVTGGGTVTFQAGAGIERQFWLRHEGEE